MMRIGNSLKFLLLLFLIWVAGLCWFESKIPKTQELIDISEGYPVPMADAVVVLTGGSMRLDEGFTLLTEGAAEYMLISGVGKDATLDDLLRLNADKQGIGKEIRAREDKITLGYMAETTDENAEEVNIWLKHHGFSSIILVTANYHMPRSLMKFSRLMPSKKIIPFPVFPDNFRAQRWWLHFPSFRLIMSEYHKYLAVRFLNI